MKDREIRLSGLLLMVTGLMLGACSAQVAQEEDFGGFLTNYDQMTEMESTDGVKILGWRKPGLDLSQYHAVKVDPVAMSPNADIGKRIGAEELEQIRESLHIKMVAELGKVVEIAEDPGPGIVRFSMALAGVGAVNRDLRWFEYTPITYTASRIAAAGGARDDVVEVWVEARWTDSDSGELLATVVRKGQSEATLSADEQVEHEDTDALLDEWARSARISWEKLK